MSGIPVVIAANGLGIPVRPVERGAPVMTVAENGLGAPIVITDNGAPFIVQGGGQPIVPGAMDVVERLPGSFTNFSRPFGLASNGAVVGLACAYRGDPVITITHGGEPITIVNQRRENGTIALLAVGRNLTTEVANLVVTATGGELDGGVLRINELDNIAPELTGWEDQNSANAPPIPPMTMTGTADGITKGVFVNNGADRSHFSRVNGAEAVFNGYIVAGPNIPDNFSTSGAWVLGAGWSIDGADFVHTGPRSQLTLDHTPATSTASTQAYIDVADVRGNYVQLSTSGSDSYGPGAKGYVSTATSFQDKCTITAVGDVRLRIIAITTTGKNISWVMFSEPAEDGAVLQPVMAYQPAWTVVASEILTYDWTPAELFSFGQAGYWPGGYAPVAGRLFLDTAGIAPATAFGQSIALARRLNGTVDASQATALSRPTSGRWPKGGRRNMLTESDSIAGFAWFVTGAAKEAGNVIRESVANSNHFLGRASQTVTINQGQTVTTRVRVGLLTTADVIQLTASTAVNQGSVYVNYRLSDNTLSIVGATITDASIVPVPGIGWDLTISYLATINFTSGTNLVVMGFTNDDLGATRLPVYTGTGKTIEFIRAQFEIGAIATPYQNVTTPNDVTEAGKPDIWFLSNDGGDSLALDAGMPSGPYGIAWVDAAGVVTISEASSPPINALRSNAVNSTQADVIIRQGAFTTAEEAQIRAFWAQEVGP